MSEDLKTVPAKVGDLADQVEKLEHVAETSRARIASLELRAATAGKLGWMDFVKIGGFVCAISGGVSWIGQTFVKAELASALTEVKISQARTETAVDFLRKEDQEEGGAK